MSLEKGKFNNLETRKNKEEGKIDTVKIELYKAQGRMEETNSRQSGERGVLN